MSTGEHFVFFGEEFTAWSEIASDLGPDQFARLSDGRAMTGLGGKRREGGKRIWVGVGDCGLISVESR